jgi:amino acid transporter
MWILLLVILFGFCDFITFRFLPHFDSEDAAFGLLLGFIGVILLRHGLVTKKSGEKRWKSKIFCGVLLICTCVGIFVYDIQDARWWAHIWPGH